MTLSMYSATVPVFQHFLRALAANLDTAAAFFAERGIDESVLLEARLYPDMYPLRMQVVRATDHVWRGLAAFLGETAPKLPDDSSVADLKKRIDTALAALDKITPEQLDGADGRDIEVIVRRQTRTMKGSRYLTYQLMPQFFFHTTTAYDILRHIGVPLGKTDFLALAARPD